jgi:pimeloyl-ACP methyl ester carboxylesterase
MTTRFKDPDFKDQAAEAALVAGMVRGTVAMIEGAGHYPQVDHPEQYVAAVEKFLASLPTGVA